MQSGNALEQILREILLANPTHDHVQLNKTYLSGSFYNVELNTNDIPKLGVVFPTNPSTYTMVALPLVFLIGWKNSPPTFSTATETVSDLVNQRLSCPEYQPPDHRLNQMAAEVPFTKAS